VKFLTAEIINILEYMHGKGVCHRDLKPANLLFDENYHLKLVDFGCSKMVQRQHVCRVSKSICVEMNDGADIDENLRQQEDIMQKRGTMVGTEDYIAPEILKGEQSGPAADLWSLGVIVFLMISGKSPFKGQNQTHTFTNIKSGHLHFTEDFSPEAKDLVLSLLRMTPAQRLGAGP